MDSLFQVFNDTFPLITVDVRTVILGLIGLQVVLVGLYFLINLLRPSMNGGSDGD